MLEEVQDAIQRFSLRRERCLCYRQYLYITDEREVFYEMPPFSTGPKYPQAIRIFGSQVQFKDESHDLSPKDFFLLKNDLLPEGFFFKRFGSQLKPGALNIVADWDNVSSFQSLIYAILTDNGERIEGNFLILVMTEVKQIPLSQHLPAFMEKLNPDWRIEDVPGDGSCGFWSTITSLINVGDCTFARKDCGKCFADDRSQMQLLRGKVYDLMGKALQERTLLGNVEDSSEELQQYKKDLRQHIDKGRLMQELRSSRKKALLDEEHSPLCWMWQEDWPYVAQATGHAMFVMAMRADKKSVTFNVFLEDGTPVDVRDLASLRAFFRNHRRVIKIFHNGAYHYQAIIRFR
jgi:hypothetical protein